MHLPIVDEFIIELDGGVTGWACALNDLGLAKIPLRECAAPRRECPRGFDRAFACREHIDKATYLP